MSRLWGQERAEAAARVGSFVITRGTPPFRPWGAEEPAAPVNDVDIAAEEAARQVSEAYERGLAEGRATVEAEIAAERVALIELVEALHVLRPEPPMPLAMLIAETVDRLVREVIGEVEIDGLTLLSRAKAAAALIGEVTQPAQMRLHPEDLALLKEAELDVDLVADPSLQRGTVLVETAEGWIEDGPAVRLERLRAELDRVAATR